MIIKGFSVVEVLLAGAVLGLLATAFGGAIIYGQEGAALSGARARAQNLAEEGLEAARNIRDSGYTNLTDGTYGLAISGGQWTFSGASDTTGIFTRSIIISAVDDNEKSVTSSVTWQQTAQRSAQVDLDTYLSDWSAVQPNPGTKIAYYDATNTNFKYASCVSGCTSAGNWTIITLDSTGTVGAWPSIAHNNGRPRISYRDTTNTNLKYASCDTSCTSAGNWTLTAVNPSGDEGRWTSMALYQGKPRVAYYDITNTGLKYASCESSCSTAGNWTRVNVDTVNNVGEYTSITLDGDKPRISYYDTTNDNLRYASCESSCTSASNWTTAAIDSAGTVGAWNSIALDAGKPRISYFDTTNTNLKYASCEGSCTTASNWTLITVDSTDSPGQWTSLALDGAKPRISYYEATNGNLKYASCESSCTSAGNWTATSVNTINDVGEYTSIALDSGKPRISYYDATNGNLRYASCESSCTSIGNWTRTTIDSVGTVGQYTSINR